MKSPLKNTSLSQPFQKSALSPTYTGMPLKFGTDLPNIYGDNLGLSSRYTGLSLGMGTGNEFGGTATNLFDRSGSLFSENITGISGGGAAAATEAVTGGGALAGIGQSQAAMSGIISGAAGIISGLSGRRRRRRAQREAKAEYDRMMQQYRNLDTSNLYADVENQYANLENVYEDLTVNRQQAEFERDAFRQQQANTMQSLSAAAGGSGIAALAQALSNQAMQQARQSSATIGMQEQQNQMLRAREASKIQQMERAGEAQAEAMRLSGAERARGLEYRQTGTLLGMSQQRLSAANQAVAQGNRALMGGIGSVVGAIGGFALGGPMGASLGSKLGSSLAG